MNIKILDIERTSYGVYDSDLYNAAIAKGLSVEAANRASQIRQAPIPDDWKVEASVAHRALQDVIAEHEGVVIVSTEATAEVKASGGFVPAPHEHPEYMTALPDHQHNFIPHVHLLREEDEKRIAGIEFDAKVDAANLLQITGELRGNLLTHTHRDFAAVGHQHDDLIAELQLTNRKLSVIEASVPTEVPVHYHPEFYDLREQMDDLKASIIAMGRLVTDISTRLVALEMKPPVDTVHVHPEFALAEDFESFKAQPRNRWKVEEISSQDFGNRKRFIVEEIPE